MVAGLCCMVSLMAILGCVFHLSFCLMPLIELCLYRCAALTHRCWWCPKVPVRQLYWAVPSLGVGAGYLPCPTFTKTPRWVPAQVSQVVDINSDTNNLICYIGNYIHYLKIIISHFTSCQLLLFWMFWISQFFKSSLTSWKLHFSHVKCWCISQEDDCSTVCKASVSSAWDCRQPLLIAPLRPCSQNTLTTFRILPGSFL